jgi:formylglycine-generating enzyme required for sulfatase activity
MPVTNISAVDAYEFAKWLGGKVGRLPTIFQWDKAAGLYDNDGREGPYEGTWKDIDDPAKRLKIGIKIDAPWKKREGIHDKSSRGCFDMAGNGDEWTNTEDSKGLLFSEIKGDELEDVHLTLRGRSYKKSPPLTFEGLRKGKGQGGEGMVGATEYNKSWPDISFRVALNPND